MTRRKDPTDWMWAQACDMLAEADRMHGQFFRLAFGAAGGFGEEIDTREARHALEGLFGAEKKIELGWMEDGGLTSEAPLIAFLSERNWIIEVNGVSDGAML